MDTDTWNNPELEAGVDEAGRGCLAGAVCAAAVILPDDFDISGLNDSKQLTAHQRSEQRQLIETRAVAWAVGWASPEEIDRINILNASILAMHRALDGLKIQPKSIAVDGNRFKPYHNIPASTYIKGDARFPHIAAASILAKTYRDEYMSLQAEKYPGYGWGKNMGYPTAAHKKAILELGITPLHRLTFRGVKEITGERGEDKDNIFYDKNCSHL